MANNTDKDKKNVTLDDKEKVSEQPAASAAPAVTATASAPQVAVKDSRDDMVPIVVFEAIDPAPRVGNFNCATEVAPIFKPKETYRVPRHVAEVIVDAGKGQLVRF